MILESLLKLVETLKVRIDEHGNQLRQSEWLTRYALVDPLLRELGWETEDPALVIPEYQSGHGRADYALLGDGKPAMMVEAKKLGTQLRDSILSQGINYCLMEGINYFSVTDGQRWEVYETHKPVPIDEKRVVEFDLKQSSSAEVCLKVLALWRQSVESDFVAVAQESVVERSQDPLKSPSVPVPDVQPTFQSEGDKYNWHPLTLVSDTESRQPVEMLLPDGSVERSLKTQVAVPIAVIRWLMNKGLLDAHHCPIKLKSARAFRYIVHTNPVHSTGSPFTSPREVNGFYLEQNFGKTGAIGTAITIIEHVGQDPAQFSIRFS